MKEKNGFKNRNKLLTITLNLLEKLILFFPNKKAD